MKTQHQAATQAWLCQLLGPWLLMLLVNAAALAQDNTTTSSLLIDPGDERYNAQMGWGNAGLEDAFQYPVMQGFLNGMSQGFQVNVYITNYQPLSDNTTHNLFMITRSLPGNDLATQFGIVINNGTIGVYRVAQKLPGFGQMLLYHYTNKTIAIPASLKGKDILLRVTVDKVGVKTIIANTHYPTSEANQANCEMNWWGLANSALQENLATKNTPTSYSSRATGRFWVNIGLWNTGLDYFITVKKQSTADPIKVRANASAWNPVKAQRTPDPYVVVPADSASTVIDAPFITAAVPEPDGLAGDVSTDAGPCLCEADNSESLPVPATKTPLTSQYNRPVTLANGKYTIRNLASTKLLAALTNPSDPNAPTDMYSAEPSTNYGWNAVRNADSTYTFRNSNGAGRAFCKLDTLSDRMVARSVNLTTADYSTWIVQPVDNNTAYVLINPLTYEVATLDTLTGKYVMGDYQKLKSQKWALKLISAPGARIGVVDTETTVNTPDVPAFMIFPNPAADKVTLRYTADVAQTGEITMLTSDGRAASRQQVALEAGPNEVEISTAKLADGQYILRLSADGRQLSQKLIILKH